MIVFICSLDLERNLVPLHQYLSSLVREMK
jgi:hypothetical protein